MRLRPVLALSGSDDFRRRRRLQSLVRANEENGWRVEHVDGGSRGGLQTAISQDGFLLQEKVLVVVENPEKANLDLLTAHLEVDDANVVLLLDHVGEPRSGSRFAKFLSGLGKLHESFKKPDKAWKLEADAVDFCTVEAKRLGRPFEPGLPESVVAVVGSDLGFLAFETFKMVTLAEVANSATITLEHVGAVIAPLGEVSFKPVTDALAARDSKKLARALTRIGKTSKSEGEAAFSVCGWTTATAYRWLQLINFITRGVSHETAAAQLGVDPWSYRTRHLPQVARWQKDQIADLISALAVSERSILDGKARPWIGLVARLLKVCG